MGGANVSRNTSRVGLTTYLESHLILWESLRFLQRKHFMQLHDFNVYTSDPLKRKLQQNFQSIAVYGQGIKFSFIEYI